MFKKLPALLLIGALALAALSGVFGSTESHATQLAAGARKIIFVQGMNSSAACEPNANLQSVANYLVKQSGGVLQNGDFLGYSYSGEYCAPDLNKAFPNYTPNYTASFTCGSIDPEQDSLGHSQLFGVWFRSLPGGGVTYDIVAHSMGGVVVAYWLARIATPQDLAKVHSIVTLDSPLRGISDWQQWAAGLWSSWGLGDCPVTDDRYADMGAGSPVIAAIQERATGGKKPFVTIRNLSDLVVPSDISTLPRTWLDRLLDDSCDGSTGSNHTCVFQNSIALQTVLDGVLHAGEPQDGQATDDWPMSRHDPAKTGYNRAETILTPPLALKWMIPGPQAPGTWSALGQPAATATRLYIEGSRVGSDGLHYGLFAVDTATGRELGHVGDPDSPTCGVAVGEGINGDGTEAPALSAGNIYFGGYNDTVGLSTDGTCLWRQSNWEGSPLPTGGLVWAFRCFTYPPGTGTAGFDPATGQVVRWLGFTSWFPPSHSNGSFHFSQGCGGAGVETDDDVTGLRKWYDGNGPYISSPILDDGVVYSTGRTADGSTGVAQAFDAVTGATLWRYAQIGNRFNYFPAIANGILYFGSQNGTFYALNTDPASSRVKWTGSTGGAINSTPVVANGVVYLGSNDGKIYAANALTGALLWSYQTPSPCAADGPLVVADGVLYVRGNSLQGGFCRPALYAFESDLDGDGVPNSSDLCPGTAPGATVDANGCSQAQVDRDADGICDPGAPSGGPAPGCTGTDNCPDWPNPAQNLPAWPLPAGDSDCDGFPSTVAVAPPNALASEAFMGTDATRHCAANNIMNNEGLPDRWPVDFNDDQLVSGGDFLVFAPVYGGIAPGPRYNARYDLNADGRISGGDFLIFAPFYGKRCTP